MCAQERFALYHALTGAPVVRRHEVAQELPHLREATLISSGRISTLLRFCPAPTHHRWRTRVDAAEGQSDLLQTGAEEARRRVAQGNTTRINSNRFIPQLLDLLLQALQEVLAVVVDIDEATPVSWRRLSRRRVGLEGGVGCRSNSGSPPAGGSPRVDPFHDLAVDGRHVTGPLRGLAEGSVEEHDGLGSCRRSRSRGSPARWTARRAAVLASCPPPVREAAFWLPR